MEILLYKCRNLASGFSWLEPNSRRRGGRAEDGLRKNFTAFGYFPSTRSSSPPFTFLFVLILAGRTPLPSGIHNVAFHLNYPLIRPSGDKSEREDFSVDRERSPGSPLRHSDMQMMPRGDGETATPLRVAMAVRYNGRNVCQVRMPGRSDLGLLKELWRYSSMSTIAVVSFCTVRGWTWTESHRL